MSKFTEVWDKVLKEKLLAKTNVGGVDLSLNDKGRLDAKGKVGGLDVSANSDGHAQATGKVAGGTMSTAVNKDGDGGYAYSKGGKTISQTAGDRDAWVSAGPNQISKRVALNNSKDKEVMEDEQVQYDAHGFATVHKDGVFYLIFNDEVVGEYDNIDDLRAAHEHVINKIKLPEEQELSENSTKEWKIVINGNAYTTSRGATEDEAINNFWKAVVEKEGIKKFLGDMVFAEPAEATTSNEDLDSLRKRAGLESPEDITEAVDYDKINLAKYLRHKKAGTLGSTGPKGPDGTSFSPNRWDKYADMSTKQDEPLNYDDIGMEEPEDEPLNYDDIGMEDPDEVYQTVALNKLQAKEKPTPDTPDTPATPSTRAKGIGKKPTPRSSVGGIKGSLKDAVKGWNKGAVVPSTSKPKPKQSLKDFEKTTPAQDKAIDDLITTTNKPKAGVGVPGITGSTISGNANIADPVKTKGAQNTDDFGYDLDADSNFAGQTRTPKSFDRDRKIRNMQLNRATGMESKENDANLVTEMDRMLRIAGLR